MCRPTGGTAVQPRHHPEHRQSSGDRAWCPRALLRSREDESSQRAFPGSEQEHGPEGLPWNVCGHLCLSVGQRLWTLVGQKSEVNSKQEG